MKASLDHSEREAFEVDEDDQVSHITDMIAHLTGGSEFIFIAVEGGTILQYAIVKAATSHSSMTLRKRLQLGHVAGSTIVLNCKLIDKWLYCAVRGQSVHRINTDSG